MRVASSLLFFHFFFSCHPLVRSQALRPSLSESNQKNCWPAIWRAKLFTLKILIAFLCLTPLSFWKKVLSYQIYQWATEIYQWATRIWIKYFALCIWMYKDIYVSRLDSSWFLIFRVMFSFLVSQQDVSLFTFSFVHLCISVIPSFVDSFILLVFSFTFVPWFALLLKGL